MQHDAEIRSNRQRSCAQLTVRPPLEVRKQSWHLVLPGWQGEDCLKALLHFLPFPWGSPGYLSPRVGLWGLAALGSCSILSGSSLLSALNLSWVKCPAQYPPRLHLYTLALPERKSWLEHRINECGAVKERWPSLSSHLLQHTGPKKFFARSRNCCCYWNNSASCNSYKPIITQICAHVLVEAVWPECLPGYLIH